MTLSKTPNLDRAIILMGDADDRTLVRQALKMDFDDITTYYENKIRAMNIERAKLSIQHADELQKARSIK